MSLVARAFFLLLFPLVTALEAGAAHAGGNRNFAGLVDIGGDRKMYLECRGAGSPTVVFISGKGNGATDWSRVLDPADPVYKAPLDAVSAGEGHELENEAAVFPAISHFTRVCAYDRPGTRIDGTDISTPVAQPHRVDQDVDDLRTLLAAAGEPVRQGDEAALTPPQASIERQVQALAPSLEDYIAANMKSFDVPGLAIGIVAGDKLVYAKGFGVRSKGGAPVDTQTIFQIGSTTKAFLSATMAIAVDRGKLHWDDRVVDLEPDFQMRDPWVTREFRVFDLLAQRSGLPPYANDFFGVLGFDRPALIRSLRYVEPVSSFRTTFAYTNITHILAGLIIAKAAGAADWNAVLQKDILDPLHMKDTTYTAAAITAAANHAQGYRYTADASIEVPLRQPFPYDVDGAGDINSNIADMSRWVSLQLADGTTPEGQRVVSAENLAYTRTPKVAVNDKVSYALGWIDQQTPNGNIVWHNGGTHSFGSMVALQLDRKLGIIVLSNQTNVGMPDAIGLWTMDRLLGNPMVDHGAKNLAQAKKTFAEGVKQFARPSNLQPSPPLSALTGKFANPGFGKAMLKTDGDVTTLELVDSGAKLRIEPWNGAVYTATLVPDTKFAAIAANLGPLPIAFAQFQTDKNGKPTILRLTFSDGQAYDFKRE